MNETGNDGPNLFSALESVDRTDRGRVRENNEDVAFCLPGSGLFVVADGMGGAREGEVAAQAVADHLRDACNDPALTLPARIRRCKEAANAASLWIRQYAARQGNPGMGTTVVMLLFDPRDPAAAACLHAGDSRLYRFRNGVLEQMTRDHSMASLAGAAHEGEVPTLFRSVITRAVGVRRDVELETTFLAVEKGDLFLLCTDGLHSYVPREEIARRLERGADLDSKAVHLVEAALSAGGEDNVTVLLVRSGGAPEGTGAGAAGSQADRILPSSARDERARLPYGRPLIVVLLIGLVGFLAIWFAWKPWRPLPDAAKPEDLFPVQTVTSHALPVPPPPEKIEEPPAAAVANPPPEREPPAVAWSREQEEVAADADRMKARHQLVLTAFTRLSEWAGKPLPLPSLMFAGRAEERPETWARYLANAQTQWCAFAKAECTRQRAEASCMNREGLNALWHLTQGTGEEDPKYKELLASWDDWRRELDRMERFLRDEADPGKPFLYAFRSDLFTPGRSGAVLADRAWDQVLPLVNTVWQKKDALLAGRNAEGAAWVEETIRGANTLWQDYAAAGHSVRTWRQSMDPDAAGRFFDRLAQERKRELGK